MTVQLPPGWRRARLRDVLRSVDRFEPVDPKKEYRLLGVKWYAGGVFEREHKLGSNIAAKELNRIERGDFLYNRLFAWKGSFAVADDRFDGGYVSGEFPIFRAKSGDFLEEYLILHFSRPNLWKEIEHQSTGTTKVSRNRWREQQLLSTWISLPPIAYQQQVVAAVKALDHVISSNHSVELRIAVLKSALTDELLNAGIPGRNSTRNRSRSENNPAHWEVCSLSEVSHIQTGLAKNKTEIAKGSVEVPYLRVANVQDGFISYDELKYVKVQREDLDRYGLRRGDVLMTEGGDNDKLGRGCVWEGRVDPCIHQNHVFAVRCGPRLMPEFLSHYTTCSQGRRYFRLASKQTTNLASINSTQLKQLPVPVPPLAEQGHISSMLNQVIAAGVVTHELVQRLVRARNQVIQSLVRG